MEDAVAATLPPGVGEAAALVGAEISDRLTPVLAGASELTSAVREWPFADDLFAGAAGVTPNELLTGAFLTGLAGLALSSAGRGTSLTVTQVAFTSARILPHTVAHTVHQAAHTVHHAAVGLRSVAAEVQSAVTGAVGPRPLPRPAPALPAIHVDYPPGAGRRELVWSNVADRQGDGWTDSRIMTQLAMLLGVLYAGFLTVWFWATRIRPQQYPRA